VKKYESSVANAKKTQISQTPKTLSPEFIEQVEYEILGIDY